MSRLPTAPAIGAALRKVTETMAVELGRPTGAAPDWSDLDWHLAKAVAAMHGVSALLGVSALRRGACGWSEFLDEQRSHTAGRHLRILDLLGRIGAAFREQQIAAVPLKGAALHALGLYAIGERPMADVDLLVRPENASRAARVIESLGYFESCVSWKERTFTPVDAGKPARLGEHTNNNIKIELHERICERLPRRLTDISRRLWHARQRPGLNGYPSPAALMLHLLLHAAGAMVSQSLRLVQLHDIALLSARMTAADWEGVVESGSIEGRFWWPLPPLQLMRRYYPSSVPPQALKTLEADCPWHLGLISRKRSLSDVSYSHLWVDAFPGIEWARSAREMLEYAIGRIRPGAQFLELRSTFTDAQAWAVGADWPRLSQSRRILRWLASRPTRPATMHVVRAALCASHD